MPAPTPNRPGRYRDLAKVNPDVVDAYEHLVETCRKAGPLDPHVAALMKVATSVGLGSWRSVHAHARKALEIGVAPDALRHVVLIALPTIGLHAALDGLKWVEESIAEQPPPRETREPRGRSRR